MKKTICMIPLYVWTLVFTLVPLAIVIYYAFISDPHGDASFSLDGFRDFFSNPVFAEVLLRSLKIAFISTLVCILLGYPAAYFLARSKSRFKFVVIILMLLPMWINFLIRTYSWLSLLEKTGLISTLLTYMGFGPVDFTGTEFAVILVSVYDFLPFMIMPIYITLLKLDQSHLDAAADLGANPFKVFMKITLPFSIPGILSGVAMVFVPSVTTFAISQTVGNGKFPLIGDLIQEQYMVVSNWQFGGAISIVTMAVVLLLMYFINRTDSEENGGGILQ
ncbi:MAG: ABC transporter permease [Oscillospiraceae bacterium]|nr:ABC transporter permease [Oscillospiraceae bacterium]